MKFPSQNTILVVDDSPTNLSVLVDHLTSETCRVLTAESAKSALNRLDFVIPDLILLDVMMPGMDGFALCKKLKSHPMYMDIPVIFLTAKSETEDILEGFNVGGVDYVTKPFHEQELKCRINTHLELKNAKRSIEEYAHKLEDRNSRLTEILNEKNEFIGVATHDLKNPLSVLSLALDLFRLKTADKKLTDVEPLMQQMEGTLKRMTTLVQQLLEINQLDVGRFEINTSKTKIIPICKDVVIQNKMKAESKGIRLEYEQRVEDIDAIVDPTAFSQIIDNLLSNAIKYSLSDTTVSVSLEVTGSGGSLPDLLLMDRKIRFVVKDQGPGIAEEEYEKVFQKFSKTSNKPTGDESSTGLGLSIAKRLVREMKGDIGFVSKQDEGSTFYMELPVLGVFDG